MLLALTACVDPARSPPAPVIPSESASSSTSSSPTASSPTASSPTSSSTPTPPATTSTTPTVPDSPACAHFVPGNYWREVDSVQRGIDGLANVTYDLDGSGWDLTAFAGVLVQIDWAMLEPEQGVYDFSRTDALLDLVEAHDLALRIKVMDRTFWDGCDTEVPFVPPYVGLSPSPDGRECFADVWEAATIDGYLALLVALQQRYDDRPAFAGFNLEETTMWLDAWVDVAPDVYAQRVRLAQELFAAAPGALLVSEFNWPQNGDVTLFPGMVDDTVVPGGAAHLNALGVGWPDSWLDPDDYTADELAAVEAKIQCSQSATVDGLTPCSWYQLGRDYHLTTLVAPNIQGGTLTGTLAEADAHYAMLSDDIGAQMITWETWSEPQADYFRQVALPTVQARGGVLANPTCPFDQAPGR